MALRCAAPSALSVCALSAAGKMRHVHIGTQLLSLFGHAADACAHLQVKETALGWSLFRRTTSPPDRSRRARAGGRSGGVCLVVTASQMRSSHRLSTELCALCGSRRAHTRCMRQEPSKDCRRRSAADGTGPRSAWVCGAGGRRVCRVGAARQVGPARRNRAHRAAAVGEPSRRAQHVRARRAGQLSTRHACSRRTAHACAATRRAACTAVRAPPARRRATSAARRTAGVLGARRVGACAFAAGASGPHHPRRPLGAQATAAAAPPLF